VVNISSRQTQKNENKMPHLFVNPITVEVVRNGLAHIANEMATVCGKLPTT
jgi:hypothetical protein